MAIISNGINSGTVSLVDQHPVISLDFSTREFTWPTDYKVVAIMGDANSQKLTFEIPASYEGIDLSTTTCVLTYWTSWVNDEGKHSTGTINLEQETEIENAKEECLYYTWTLDQYQTANSGEVRFKIGFYLIFDDSFDSDQYENLTYIITNGSLTVYNGSEVILTTQDYYALSSNSGNFMVVSDKISEQAKIRLTDWATKAEQAANEATGAANEANVAAINANKATDSANAAADSANTAAANADAKMQEMESEIIEAKRNTEESRISAEAAEKVAQEVNNIVAYIIEAGTKPVKIRTTNELGATSYTDTGFFWHYNKYSSGQVECWAVIEKEAPPESWDQWGSLYYTFVGEYELPFTFSETEKPLISYDLDSYQCWGQKYHTGNAVIETQNTVGNLYAVSPNDLRADENSALCVINLYIRGQLA